MIRRIVSGFIFLLCILPLPFCKKGHSQPHRDIELINPEFDQKLESMLNFSIPLFSVDELRDQLEDVIVIDAREQKEYEISHIPRAHFGGYNKFDPDAFSHVDKDATIVLYCSVGYRSEKVAEKMRKAGFTNVHNLYGSIFEWVNSGYPVVDSDGNSTTQVHTYNKKWGQWVDGSNIKKVH